MKCIECGSEYDGRLKICPYCPVVEVGVDNPGELWESYGQTRGGEEILPGFILNSGKVYKVGRALSQRALTLFRDAFQIKVENRRPVMGDTDYE